MTRSSKRPEPQTDPRSVGEVVLQTILAVCGDDPKKLRNALSAFPTGHELEVGIRKRLNEVEGNLPGLERDGVGQDVTR